MVYLILLYLFDFLNIDNCPSSDVHVSLLNLGIGLVQTLQQSTTYATVLQEVL